jgi:hypothetical protein
LVAEEEGKVQQRYCGNCGSEVAEGQKFCGNCGTPVHEAAVVPTPEADVQTPPPPSSEPRRRGVGYTILGVALLLCGIVCVIIVVLALMLHFLSGPIPNMAFGVLFIGGIGLACLFGAWQNLRRTS